MPLLKYRCKQCNTLFEALVATSQMDSVRCEQCGGDVVRAYEGACLFGMQHSTGERGDCGNCSAGCDNSHRHGSGCACGCH